MFESGTVQDRAIVDANAGVQVAVVQDVGNDAKLSMCLKIHERHQRVTAVLHMRVALFSTSAASQSRRAARRRR
jgi:hypothetical protein